MDVTTVETAILHRPQDQIDGLTRMDEQDRPETRSPATAADDPRVLVRHLLHTT